MTEEIWKPVLGYESSYEVSNLGRVRSIKTKNVLKRLYTTKAKHPYLTLWLDGKRKNRTIHSLVIESFVGLRPAGCEVRHGDGDANNNELSNLSYSSRRENTQDRKWHNLPKLYKLTGWDVLQIKNRLAYHKHGDIAAIARDYGVHHSTIWRIAQGKVHADVA